MRRLSSRVALVTALSIGSAGAVVALVGGLLAERFARVDEDARLLDAAGTLVVELREPGADPLTVTRDETAELLHAGLRFAVHEHDVLVAGDAELPHVAAGSCTTVGTVRACGTALDEQQTAVAARSSTAGDEHRTRLWVALLAAVLLTTLLGALLARSIARFSVGPLERLTVEVAKLGEGDTGRGLGPPEGVEEVDALRDALSATLSRLREALTQSQRFAGDAAHELRTPLTAIQGELELAAEGLDHEDAGSIARARQIALRLTALVDRLLVLARPAGQLETTEEVHLEEVFQDVLLGLPKASAERVHIRAETVAPLDGDAALLGAMLASGLENALKYSEGPVTLSLLERGGEFVVQIDDEGPGVLPGEREAMFRPFHRSPSARASGVRGHGIGLSLVAHVAALHGGSAHFADGAVGARLEIILPRSTGG